MPDGQIVKQHGKQMIVWEGFGRGGKVKIPKDVIVMEYEIRFYMPGDLVNDGYKVINASWTPLYVVNLNCRPPEEIYAWNLYQFKPYDAKPSARGRVVLPNENVIGARVVPLGAKGAYGNAQLAAATAGNTRAGLEPGRRQNIR